MANLNDTNVTINEMGSFSFSDFPEDVQLCILSFLTPSEISTFACTSRRYVSLCQCDTKLWYAMCDRRWGLKTQIKKWGGGKISFKLLYNTLIQWENLIGFWRRSGNGRIIGIGGGGGGAGGVEPPPLIFFEWGSSFVTGSRVSPAKSGTYHVIKSPFLWMSLASNGETVNFLDRDGSYELPDDFSVSELGSSENDLIPVNVSFMGKNHVVLEENLSFACVNSPELRKSGFRRTSSSNNLKAEDGDVIAAENGSPVGSLPDRFVSEIYQYFANRTSPGTERRRQRRREKERQGRRKWESEHFVKIVNCSPTPSRPLQGLWKVLFLFSSKCLKVVSIVQFISM